MFLLTVFAACLVTTNAFVHPSVPMLDGKIVGGTIADITEAPYQVALLLDIYGIGSYNHVCGGSIITRNVIVTAAHCTVGTIAIRLRIRAGSALHNKGGQVVQVSRILQHFNFTDKLNNDIALLYLANSLVLSKSIATVTLPSQGQTVADGANAFVTGWGSLSEGGPYPTHLYKVTIPIVNQQRCVNAYSDINLYHQPYITTNMICAGRLITGGADSCQGDSGGPLTVGGILIGITSWGRGCAQAGYPGVWTRVPNFVTWINTNT